MTTKSIEIKQAAPASYPYGARVAAGLAIVGLLSLAAWWITQQVYGVQLPGNIPGKVLEYPLWAALTGLAGNLLLRFLKLREVVRPGIRTELFLKVGLVLLGATVNLSLLLTAARGGILQTVILIPSVFFFAWWLGGRFGIDDKLRAVMSTALAVCGVSAAVAAAGSVTARKEHVTYITGLVILVALPMMIIMPLVGQALGLSQTVAGAWFGGNIDTTAAVVGAGTIFGQEAQEVASIVKATQNAMIGVVAFLLAIGFSSREAGVKTRPSLRMIWDRFPKFVLGFVLASILFSIGWIDGGKGSTIDALKNWAFTFAFVGMGLEFSIAEFKQMGWKPVAVFLLVTIFNTLLALVSAWVIFTVIFPM